MIYKPIQVRFAHLYRPVAHPFVAFILRQLFSFLAIHHIAPPFSSPILRLVTLLFATGASFLSKRCCFAAQYALRAVFSSKSTNFYKKFDKSVNNGRFAPLVFASLTHLVFLFMGPLKRSTNKYAPILFTSASRSKNWGDVYQRLLRNRFGTSCLTIHPSIGPTGPNQHDSLRSGGAKPRQIYVELRAIRNELHRVGAIYPIGFANWVYCAAKKAPKEAELGAIASKLLAHTSAP